MSEKTKAIDANERSAGNRYLEAHRPGWSYLPGLSKLWEEAFAIGYAACALYRGKPPVAEEPEWEYGIKCPPMDVAWLGTRESVEATLARWAGSGAPLSEGQGVFRRIKQGPWVPVKQEGAE